MNRLGKREYIKLIAETLTEEYGDTLKEYGTDVQLAEKVLEVLTKFLYFNKIDINYNEFRKWKSNRKNIRTMY